MIKELQETVLQLVDRHESVKDWHMPNDLFRMVELELLLSPHYEFKDVDRSKEKNPPSFRRIMDGCSAVFRGYNVRVGRTVLNLAVNGRNIESIVIPYVGQEVTQGKKIEGTPATITHTNAPAYVMLHDNGVISTAIYTPIVTAVVSFNPSLGKQLGGLTYPRDEKDVKFHISNCYNSIDTPSNVGTILDLLKPQIEAVASLTMLAANAYRVQVRIRN